jgi:hypothetical protein
MSTKSHHSKTHKTNRLKKAKSHENKLKIASKHQSRSFSTKTTRFEQQTDKSKSNNITRSVKLNLGQQFTPLVFKSSRPTLIHKFQPTEIQDNLKSTPNWTKVCFFTLQSQNVLSLS